MTVIDPEIPPVEEELPPPPPVVAPPANKPAHRDVCKNCMRPVVVWPDGSVSHVNGAIDIPENKAFCLAELYVEEPIKWGFLNVKGKSDFEVKSGPSKVHSGWSGGGVA